MTQKCPVTIRGVLYESQAEAARQLGVPQTTIGIALDRGTIDNVGLGRNRHRMHPVRVDGHLYESQGAAARAMDVNHENFNVVCRKMRKQKRSKFMFKGHQIEADHDS